MQKDGRKLFAICIYILIGVIGLPVGIHQWIAMTRNGWVCYSKHGHILETVAGCKFNLYSGLFISLAALVIGIHQAWKRRQA